MDDRRELGIADLGSVEYVRSLKLQQAMVAARIREDVGDSLLMLEHPHVYTLGRGADERFIIGRTRNVSTYRVSRGGQVTYHGPGQLVAYPILKLIGADRDIGKYLRKLEQVMIDSLASCGIHARRRNSMTGVWVGDRKIGSIGVGIRRWVTYHGVALNVAPDLSYFGSIVPCGITGCEMTSMAQLGKPEISVSDFASVFFRCFMEVFGFQRAAHLDPLEVWTLAEKHPAVEART